MVQQQFEESGMTRFNFQNGENTPSTDVMYPMSSDVIGNHDNQPQGYHKSSGTPVMPEIPQKLQNEQDLKLSAHKEAIYKFVFLLYIFYVSIKHFQKESFYNIFL